MGNNADSTGNRVKGGSCKRLPGLWVICVFFGLCGALHFLWIPSGTWLGRVVFSAFSIGFLLAAWSLWFRKRWGPAAAKVVWIGCLFWLHPGILYDFPSLLTPTLILAGIWLVIMIAVCVYLHKRRDILRNTQAPPLCSPTFVVTAFLFVFFFTVSALLHLDEPAESFPELERTEEMPPPEQNGFSVFREIVKEEIFREPKEKEDEANWESIPDQDSEEFEEWLPAARRMLELNVEYLEAVEEMLERPFFVFPPEELRHDALLRWNRAARQMSRVLMARSAIKLADGNTEQAQETALQLVELGLKWAGGDGTITECLTGLVILQMGLGRVRECVSFDEVYPSNILSALRDYSLAGRLERALKESLKGNYKRTKYMLKALSSIETQRNYSRKVRAYLRDDFSCEGFGCEIGVDDVETTILLENFIANVRPFYKPNMSVNRLGSYYSRVIRRLESANTFTEVIDEPATGISPLFWMRNPTGSILLEAGMLPGYQKVVEVYWNYIARVRMTRVFLALRAYQLEHDELPGSLEELEPEYLAELPEDPFSGEVIGYDPDADRPLLYSVGIDGELPDPEERYERDNLVLELEFARP